MGLTQARFVFWAAQDGRVDDLRFHLSHVGKEALRPFANSPKRRAPIHMAALGGHPQCVKVLYEAGSSLNIHDKDGHTPLHLAAAHQHLSCVKVLLQLGADIDVTTRFGVTALHLAASVGNTPIIQFLVEAGANLNAQESWGQTPLAIATVRDRLYCMEVLLRLGAEKEVKDYHHKQTALHIAAASRDEECVLLLLDSGCSVHAVNGEGLSALGVALVNKFYRVVPLLLEYGAQLNDTDRQHVSPPLENHLSSTTDSPRTLLQLSRVSIRQFLGPSRREQLGTLELPPHLEEYVHNVLDVCSSETIKSLSLQNTFQSEMKQSVFS